MPQVPPPLPGTLEWLHVSRRRCMNLPGFAVAAAPPGSGLAQFAPDARNLNLYFDTSAMSKDDQTRAVSAAEMIIQRNKTAKSRFQLWCSAIETQNSLRDRASISQTGV